MALNFGILSQVPSFGQQFAAGQQAAQAQQERNMLRQQQARQLQMQEQRFKQEGEDRAFELEERKKRAEREAQFQSVAKLIREQGMDPDDPKVLGQFAEAALKAQNPALVSFVGEMAERAAKRRDVAAVQKRIQIAMGGVEGPPEPAANALAPAPAVSPAVNAMLAPPPAQRELLAGTPFAIGMAPPPAAAPAPAVPAAPAVADNARKIAELERRRDALELGGTAQELALAKQVQRQIEKLAPPKPETFAPSADMQGYELAKREGFKGTFFDYKRQLAVAGRAPSQPREAPAPSITQIQDPTDSNRMITIDARRYAGGGVGSPGVIGTSGKTAPIAAADQKKLEGQQSAADIIDTLRAAYQDLDQRRAVPSEQRSVLSNLTSYIASTGVGQVAGRMAGTPEQTQRDVIQSARNQILNAVKNATGMSAQQLNSNVEFKSWVESLTDPTKSYQANTAILDNLEKFVASGGKYSAKKSGGAVTPAPAGQAPAGRREIAPGVFVTERP